MNNFADSSLFIGAIITLAGYQVGLALYKKTRFALLNPILTGMTFTACLLLFLKIDYKSYNESAQYISYLLTPATICLSLPLYENLRLIKKHCKAIAAGILMGTASSTVSVYLLSLIFKFSHVHYVTFLPKSVTTAIGIGICEELGGLVNIAVISIIFSGIIGYTISPALMNFFRIKEPIAVGIAIGSASHAIGTAKAMEMGETEGAMSGLAIALTGILTVFAVPLAAMWI